MNIIYNELLKNHTSFKIGGPADQFCSVTSVDEIIELLDYAKKENIPVTIMGNGSNLLVSDKGIRGLVIKLAKGFDDIAIDGTKVVAESGILLSRLANLALKAGLTGLEFASGIPGTLGGAVCMNAGAYDGEMKQVVRSVTLLDPGQGVRTLSNEEMEFAYRRSILTDHPEWVVLSVEVALQAGEPEKIWTASSAFCMAASEAAALAQAHSLESV